MEDGAFMNPFQDIQKLDLTHIFDPEEINVCVSNMALLHLQSKVNWFSSAKDLGEKDHSFRSDHMCLLVLSCYAVGVKILAMLDG